MEVCTYKTFTEAQYVNIANYFTIREENLPTVSSVCQLKEFVLMGIKINNKTMYQKN
jgi:hypothetical protein